MQGVLPSKVSERTHVGGAAAGDLRGARPEVGAGTGAASDSPAASRLPGVSWLHALLLICACISSPQESGDSTSMLTASRAPWSTPRRQAETLSVVWAKSHPQAFYVQVDCFRLASRLPRSPGQAGKPSHPEAPFLGLKVDASRLSPRIRAAPTAREFVRYDFVEDLCDALGVAWAVCCSTVFAGSSRSRRRP
jgi:hypothetical protein